MRKKAHNIVRKKKEIGSLPRFPSRPVNITQVTNTNPSVEHYQTSPPPKKRHFSRCRRLQVALNVHLLICHKTRLNKVLLHPLPLFSLAGPLTCQQQFSTESQRETICVWIHRHIHTRSPSVVCVCVCVCMCERGCPCQPQHSTHPANSL